MSEAALQASLPPRRRADSLPMEPTRSARPSGDFLPDAEGSKLTYVVPRGAPVAGTARGLPVGCARREERSRGPLPSLRPRWRGRPPQSCFGVAPTIRPGMRGRSRRPRGKGSHGWRVGAGYGRAESAARSFWRQVEQKPWSSWSTGLIEPLAASMRHRGEEQCWTPRV